MPTHKIIILGVAILVPILAVFFVLMYIRKSNRTLTDTQEDISDKELLEYINSQPDKIVDTKMLMRDFDLSKYESTIRLRHFYTNGILTILRSGSGLKSYYTLSRPIDKSYDLNLTDDPFMTKEDLLMIFKHYDYQVSMQEICLCTGLPLKIILEEMKYFEKEGVVNRLLKSNKDGFSHQRLFTLCEPYRSNPDAYMDLRDANIELKEIYRNLRNA
ncbi:MAG: hypothetical protein AAGA77_26215 [Bacteroidota bacterium]